MEYQWKLSEWKLEGANNKLDKITKERDSLKEKLDSWNKSGLSHVEFVEKQRASDVKTGLGYGEYSTEEITTSDEELIKQAPPGFKKEKGYSSVPPPTGKVQPPRADVTRLGVDNMEIRNKIVSPPSPSSSEYDTCNSQDTDNLGEQIKKPELSHVNDAKRKSRSFSNQSVPSRIHSQSTDKVRKSHRQPLN